MLFRCVVHPKGLDPFQAAKAWHLRMQEGLPWKVVRLQVRTMSGAHPGKMAAEDAVSRVDAQRSTSKFRKTGIASSGYARCGCAPLLSPEQKKAVVAFVKRWRNKRFCTANYIIQELKLSCKKKTVHRVLNDAGYHWRPVAKKGKLSEAQLKQRQAFVDAHLKKPAAWWRKHMGLVLDGVTLTRAPKPFSGKEKHATQAIKHMWVKSGEALDNSLHTYNRYGVQLGHKVPFWGGFTGCGVFTLRLWTERSKLDKETWASHIGTSVKRAASGRTIWHDNEGFLKQPKVYRKHQLTMKCFPPNSGDLNPIENVWAWLRYDLAKREMDDLSRCRTLTAAQFRQRASQILKSFSVSPPAGGKSRLEKLIDGMPNRLARCKANNYGKCGM